MKLILQKSTLTFIGCLFSFLGIGQTSINITSPNGGENFQPGTAINFQYVFEEGVAYDDLIFYYSIDNGASYNWIGDTLFSTAPPISYASTYTWNIPLGINSTTCLIRAEIYRTAGGIGVVAQDTSENVFTIQPPVTDITILTPNGGENLQDGEFTNLEYHFEHGEAGDDLIFYYSIDNGATYTLIGDSLFSAAPPISYTSTYTWNIPLGINSTECLIRTEIYRTAGGAGIVAQDTSDNTFIISDISGLINNPLDEISVFPNPAIDEITLNLQGLNEVSIKLFDPTGKLIYQKEIKNPVTHVISIDQPKGLYFLQIGSREYTRTIKIILE